MELKKQTLRAFWKQEMLNNFNYRPKQNACFIQDEETIDLGSLSVQVIATPGHTPGHLSFFFPEEKILFLGDYDLTSFGPWYGDVYSSIEQTIKSIHTLKPFPPADGLLHTTPDFLRKIRASFGMTMKMSSISVKKEYWNF